LGARATARGRLTTHPVDLATGAGLDAAFAAIGGPPAGIINAAALSSPAACEADPGAAAALNVPTRLLGALGRACRGGAPPPPFVQLSTDQVYSGEGTPGGGWSEAAGTVAPLNAYARTKAAAEAAIRSAWPANHLILRCSVMVGALPPAWPLAPGRVPFLQFAAAAVKDAGAAAGGTSATFYSDEWRSFVGVRDVARVCVAAIKARPPGTDVSSLPSTVNMGGPARLSRAGLARAVARGLGLPPSVVREAPGAAHSAAARVPSPADIGMDVTVLREGLGFEPRSVEEVIAGELLAVCR
jgi:dTDP-4-dehydrorhamnose reductase